MVSRSSSWNNDATLTALMGRVPARCIVLLEDLDAAFTRPGRMDVWIEFKNTSRWQAEQLFRTDADLPTDDAALDAALSDINLDARRETRRETPVIGDRVMAVPPVPSSPTPSTLKTTPTTVLVEKTAEEEESEERAREAAEERRSPEEKARIAAEEKARIARLEEEHAIRHAAAPLSNATLAALARKFAESIPDEEFSVAALQGCTCLFPVSVRWMDGD